MLGIKILKESVVIAFQQLLANKLRTLLSLLGIMIGILCIISVLTAVDSLENNIHSSVSKLGDNVVYIQKWPWAPEPGEEYAWWKYWKRPVPDAEELKVLQSRSNTAEALAIEVFIQGKTIKCGSRVIEGANVVGVSHSFHSISDFDFMEGRYFTLAESNAASGSAILGYTVAASLFPEGVSPLGRTVKFMGRNLKVIGVLALQGEDLLGWSSDDNVFIPYNFAKNVMNTKRLEPFIVAKAKTGVSIDEMKDELAGILRSHRRLRPLEEDNFSMNQLSILTNGLSAMFGIVNFAGWLIGLFSILVGGFGIANIMFVSVKERTNQIGIKKALGAKNLFIMIEFLLEAIVLCLIGGFAGMGVVYGLTLLGNHFIDFNFTLTLRNMVIGLSLSVGIGLVSGFIPALLASRMNPVDAIRS